VSVAGRENSLTLMIIRMGTVVQNRGGQSAGQRYREGAGRQTDGRGQADDPEAGKQRLRGRERQTASGGLANGNQEVGRQDLWFLRRSPGIQRGRKVGDRQGR